MVTIVDGYLRRVLADPSVKVAYRSPDGRTVAAIATDDRSSWPSDDDERAITLIRRDGAVLGALETDAAIASQPDVIEVVGTAAGLAIETAGLAALANARVEDGRRLTARLVTSADVARRDLHAELEAGPCSR